MVPVPGLPGLNLSATFCGQNGVSVGTSQSRPPAKRQYEPRIHTVQHGHDVYASKYGMLARLVPTETPFSPQNLDPRLELRVNMVDRPAVAHNQAIKPPRLPENAVQKCAICAGRNLQCTYTPSGIGSRYIERRIADW